MENQTLAKRLETRHINMIALGGSIGTGIFLAMGYSISLGGPGGAMLGYAIIAVLVYFLMTSLGEMSVHHPSSGSLYEYSYMYVGQSCGFANGWNYWLSWAIALAAEISAASMVMSYWFPHISPVLFSTIFFIIVSIINLFSVRVYGETEYWLSSLKVGVIIAFIVVGGFAVFKEPNLGLHNWQIGDAPFHQGWFGFLSVFLYVGYAFQGTELLGVASGEAKHPEYAIPRSVRMVFWRLTLFYILSVAIISCLIPYTDPRLTYQNNIIINPYTLVFKDYLFSYAADIINFIILVALISAANASMYTSTRILWYLGKKKHAPTFFTKISRGGVPLFSLLATALVGSVVFCTSFISNGQFFTCMVQIASISCFLSWFAIALSHYKFRKNILPKLGGVAILKYKARFYPYAQIISMLAIFFIIAAQFLTFSKNYTFLDVIGVYGGIIPYFLFYLGHKLYVKFSSNNQILGKSNDSVNK